MSTVSDPGEISAWIQQLQAGQVVGFDEVWKRFHSKLYDVIGKRKQKLPDSILDSQAIVASIFESVWRASQEGRLVSIKSCDELWWWLLTIAKYKTADHIRRATKKSSGGDTVRLSIDEQIHTLISDDPSPAEGAALQETLERGLELLQDDVLRQIALLKIQGYSNREIEECMNLAPATVTRKLSLIRKKWAQWAEELQS